MQRVGVRDREVDVLALHELRRHLDLDDLGVTLVRFANGVRLNIKPTKLRANEVLVRTDIGHGRLDLPRDHPLATWTAQAVELSGVKGIDYEDMQKALAANVASIDFSLEDSTFKFEGRTQPTDLATQLQIFAAYASDPAYRPEVFKRLQQSYLTNLDLDPGLTYSSQVGSNQYNPIVIMLHELMHGFGMTGWYNSVGQLPSNYES